MPIPVRIILLCLPAVLMLPSMVSVRADEDGARLEFFEKKIRPILVGHCYTCHSADTNSRGGLRVDDRNGLLSGGGRGPAVIPGKPEMSLLIKAVRHAAGTPKMPPESKLSDEQVTDLARWIEQGAIWPQESTWKPVDPGPEYEALRASHWAWQPLRDHVVPAVKDQAWGTDPVDQFLLARLEAQGLAPVRDADRRQWLRRVTYDLTGLPPTNEEVDAFLRDAASGAEARVVDRLLDSLAFGERWARHWLDVARYGESTGSSRNLPYPHAWRYRDYVIRAFQADKPYDQFLREQIAGDLLPAATDAEWAEHQIATGFLVVGARDVNQRFKVRYVMDNIDEQIDTVSRAVLGLTVSCARCHNHKFDPIPQTDYYALAGIFHSTDLCAGLRNKMGGGGLDYYDTTMLLPLGTSGLADARAAVETVRLQRAMAEAQQAVKTLQDDKSPEMETRKQNLQAARQRVNQLRNELNDLADPAMHGPVAMGVRDAATVADTEIRIRGEAERLGPKVPRGFLSIPAVPDAPPIVSGRSGRLEFSHWLTSPQNPLTPRVYVNRVWKQLFGTGLVQSVDNFGVTGDQPSHPELLDHLALRFVQNRWSTKSLIRSLVLTRAYRLSGESTDAHRDIDPGNRLLWRHAPRRLDAEELRDSLLCASGTLDRSPLPGSPARNFKVIELNNDGKDARELEKTAAACRHRSIYLPLLRGLVPPVLETFDFADQGLVTGHRGTTTVAPQALYLLNDPFVRQQSQSLAEKLLACPDQTEADRIRAAFSLVLGRAPSAVEVDQIGRYLDEYAAAVPREMASSRAVGTSPEGHPQPAVTLSSNGSSGMNPVETPGFPPPPAYPGDAVPPGLSAVKPVPVNPVVAAWSSFCQALFGSAEFRYVK